jgi:hypothetical protein
VANRPSLPGYPAARADVDEHTPRLPATPERLAGGRDTKALRRGDRRIAVTHAQSVIDEVRKLEPAQAPPSLLSLS